MTERPTFSNDRGLAGRLALSRLATRASMMVERGWPLLLPLLIVASLFLSLSWLGVFRGCPDVARIGLVAAFGLAALAALYPLRFFRMPSPPRSTAASRPPTNCCTAGAGADRPAERPRTAASRRRCGANTRGAWPRSSTASAPTCRAPRVPERDPWGLRAVAALLLVTAFAFSLRAARRQDSRRLQRPRRRTTPCRRASTPG